MKYIVLYPKQNQMNKIEQYKNIIEGDILIVQSKYMQYEENLIKNECNIKVLCCHEEGIYWLRNNLKCSMSLTFNKECIKMTNKWETYRIFKKSNIPCVNKTISCDKINEFPIIAKPNIGFGSIGVQKINNREDLDGYIKKFDNMMKHSIVEEDRKIFFENEVNFPIFEECIENDQFFSVPFIVDSNKKITIFPVVGLRKENTTASNYKWATFMYGNDILNKEIYNRIKNIVQDITDKWIREPSVNLVEMVYDLGNDKLNVLEFSPRTVGGRISKMIEYAIGLNLDNISIDLFFGINNFTIKEKKNKMTILDICNVDANGKEVSGYSNEYLQKYELVDIEETKSPIGNNLIKYKIYEREI